MGIKNANGNRLANYSSPVSNGDHCKYRGCFWNDKRKAEIFCFSSISIGLLTYLHIGDIYFCLIFVGIIIICMFDCLRNILAFASTFLVISTSTMLLIQVIVCFVTWDWTYKKNTDYRIIIIGILVALLLIPFYYLPVQ